MTFARFAAIAAAALAPTLIWCEDKRPLTVADTIEFRRPISDFAGESIVASPSGRRYIAIVQQGDVARNATRVQLISGETTSLVAAMRSKIVADLLTTSKAVAVNLLRQLRWIDEERVAFIWDGGEGPPQVMTVDVTTGERKTLTRHPTEIVKFDVGADGRTLVFGANRARDVAKLDVRKDGLVIGSQSLIDIFSGNYDGWDPKFHFETFVVSAQHPAPRRVVGNDRERFRSRFVRIAPDARHAISDEPALEFPKAWDAYTYPYLKDVMLPAARRSPAAKSQLSQFWVIDLERATSRPLWSLPNNLLATLVWSPDSRSVVISPAFLPPENADAAALAGLVAVEVDIETGRFSRLPLPPEHAGARGLRAIRWDHDGTVELSDLYERVKLRFRKNEGQWQLLSDSPAKTGAGGPEVRIELGQALEMAPALYAVETRTGLGHLIFDLNPQLKDRLLGRVESLHWMDKQGRPWSGVLYYPVHYSPERRFPLVLQPHGFIEGRFALDGVHTTAYAAQPLANRDVAVLLLRFPDGVPSSLTATPGEPETVMEGCESAIDALVAKGLVDRQKVGVVGFSRVGWYVEYMLTQARFPIAAAIASDNFSASYGQYVLWDRPDFRGELEKDIGAPPFGEGLQTWLRRAPGFNADKIKTPLRIEMASSPLGIAGVVSKWELFSHLRYLKKAVEMFVVPDVEHASHPLQNPAQRLASQGGTVDWFDFWLNGHEDPDPAKAAQYERWKKLRSMMPAAKPAG